MHTFGIDDRAIPGYKLHRTSDFSPAERLGTGSGRDFHAQSLDDKSASAGHASSLQLRHLEVPYTIMYSLHVREMFCFILSFSKNKSGRCVVSTSLRRSAIYTRYTSQPEGHVGPGISAPARHTLIHSQDGHMANHFSFLYQFISHCPAFQYACT